MPRGPEAAGGRRFDAAAIAAVTNLYREILPPAAPSSICCRMGQSPTAEIPSTRRWGRTTPASLPRTVSRRMAVQDLNVIRAFPLPPRVRRRGDVVSIQHLTRPCEVIREWGASSSGGAAHRDLLELLPADRAIDAGIFDDAGHLCLIAIISPRPAIGRLRCLIAPHRAGDRSMR